MTKMCMAEIGPASDRFCQPPLNAASHKRAVILSPSYTTFNIQLATFCDVLPHSSPLKCNDSIVQRAIYITCFYFIWRQGLSTCAAVRCVARCWPAKLAY